MAVPATDVLSVHAAANPERLAVVEGDRALTYEVFNRLVNRYANAIVARSVQPGEKVIWCGRNGLEVVAVVNAARKLGTVSVPLNYRFTTEEAAYVIDNADASIVLFDAEQAEQLAGARAACPNVRDWIAFRLDGAAPPPWASSLDELAATQTEADPAVSGAADFAGATMIYTSGTTGNPKGAVRSNANIAVAGALVMHIGFQPDDVYLTTGPLYHSGPLGFMGIAQLLGGTVIVQRRFEPEAWLDLVQRHRVTTTFAAPTPIRMVLDLGLETVRKYDYSSMQRMIANAAPWPFDLKRRYVEAFGEGSLWEVYGSTELGVDTVLGPGDQMRKPGSCGMPAPLVEIALFDDDGNQVTEPHVPGELFVRSGYSFETYYKAGDKFDEGRRGDWLTVGDVAYFDEEGFYFICDRKKDMIISGGMNIYPAEIEAVLVAHPGVQDAAVFGIPSEQWGEAVHATVALYPGHEPTDVELESFARQHLAGYKAPRSFSRVEQIPRTGSGKILKRELRAPYWEGRTSQVG